MSFAFSFAVRFSIYCSLVLSATSAQRVGSNSDKPVFRCTDVEFPNDIVCDLENLFKSKDWLEPQPLVLREINFQFKPSSNQLDTCYISYKPKNPNSLRRFVFDAVRCGISTKVPLPRDKKMADFEVIRIGTNKPDNKDYRCDYESKNEGKVSGQLSEGHRRYSNLIKYRYETYGCVLPIAIGRDIVEDTEPCSYDGRRCRPRRFK